MFFFFLIFLDSPTSIQPAAWDNGQLYNEFPNFLKPLISFLKYNGSSIFSFYTF